MTLPMPTLPTVIIVTSHRGGSLKSSLASALSWKLATLGNRTALLDCTPTGGAFSLESPLHAVSNAPAENHPAAARAKRHTELPLAMNHLGRLPASSSEFRTILAALGTEATHVVVDAPVCSKAELDLLASASDLVLVTIPSDANCLRSITPFLQVLQEIRAAPGRAFRIKGILVRTGIPLEECVVVDQFLEDTLAPMLSGAQIPFDEPARRTISAAQAPDQVDEQSPIHSHLSLLATELLELLETASA
jgi:cellulose biosynthesis protein BcsQ